MTALDIDLTDTETFVSGDPHAAWARLRREAPVYWNKTSDGGFWALTRYDDIVLAYTDPVTFSSAQGAVLGGSYRRAVDSASGRMMVATDPPTHTLLRRVVKQAVFSEARIEAVGRQVADLVAAALARMAREGGGDFARDVALELPTGALMAMFGIDHGAARSLVGMTRASIDHHDGGPARGGTEETRLARAHAAVIDFFAALVDERRRKPADDAISAILSAMAEQRAFDEDTLLYNLLNLAVGGNETTPHTASAAILAFANAPAQWRLFREGRLVKTTVEEALRFASTNAYVKRVATTTTRIRDVEIAAGDVVTLWNASANRDEEHFVDAHAFDIRRDPNRHIAFGVGIHRCVGAGTARPELSALFEALRGAKGEIELAGPPVRLRSNFMLGINSLPIRIR